MASEHLTRRRLARLSGQVASKPLGYVYFVGAEEVGRVKIGFSQNNPDGRFRKFETGSPVALSKLGLMRGTSGREVELHDRFRRHHVRLEWFRLDAEILEFIKSEAIDWEVTYRVEKGLREGYLRQFAAKRVEEFNKALSIANGLTEQSDGL